VPLSFTPLFRLKRCHACFEDRGNAIPLGWTQP
jgi:hypothetical protein